MALDKQRLKVVLCWHMHQPEYRDLDTGTYHQPWTYLHAIKDYVDMAAHLEANPAGRAVVNFAPTLIEQIDDYAQQVAAYLEQGDPIRDPLLSGLNGQSLPTGALSRAVLVKACLRANEDRLIQRYAPYQQLAAWAKQLEECPEDALYLSDQFIYDLLMWYHLAWMGETVRREDRLIKALMDKERGYDADDRRAMLEIIAELLNGVIPRYRALAEKGQIELSVTPYAHPIVPLLLDIESTHEAMPQAPLPQSRVYPGGAERVEWHIAEGLRVFEQHFGFRPKGCWPSEGSVSEATARVMGESGFEWIATGETVLANSMRKSGVALSEGDKRWLHRPYEYDQSKVACFFRDDGLSDLIGFTYTNWHADDAVGNLIHHLENIAKVSIDDPNALVSIILDGENAWEYYPENGYYFLSALYERLAEHPELELTTFGDALGAGIKSDHLDHLVAGSWVYGSFSTWIGEKDKNRGWDMLIEAKRAYDLAVEEGRVTDGNRAEVNRQLAICEGSDWFWWFGDYNPSDAVHDFERLYRHHLANLYALIGEAPPGYLHQSFTHGGAVQEAGGVMRRGQEEG